MTMPLPTHEHDSELTDWLTVRIRYAVVPGSPGACGSFGEPLEEPSEPDVELLAATLIVGNTKLPVDLREVGRPQIERWRREVLEAGKELA